MFYEGPFSPPKNKTFIGCYPDWVMLISNSADQMALVLAEQLTLKLC